MLVQVPNKFGEPHESLAISRRSTWFEKERAGKRARAMRQLQLYVMPKLRPFKALSPSLASAFHVLALEPMDGPLSRRPPSRWLLGEVAPEEGLAPLEEFPLPLPAACAMPALAADDHQVLYNLLGEVIEQGPTHQEVRWDGFLLRLWRIESPTRQARILEVLDGMLIRPLGPLPEDTPALTALATLSDPGLRLEPVHRGLRGTVFDEETFLTLVRDYARIYDLDVSLTIPQGLATARECLASLAATAHAVLMVLPGGRTRLLRFRQALDLAHIKAIPRNPTLRSLDLALLNALIFQTVLGLSEPERPDHPQIFDVPSLEALVQQVDGGLSQVGFALNPPPVWEIRAVMEARQTLPPHTLRLSPLLPVRPLLLSSER